jgi:hypothetical protein
MFNPFSMIARWWRRRRHKGLTIIELDAQGKLVTRPYDGAKLHVATLDGVRPLRMGETLSVADVEGAGNALS